MTSPEEYTKEERTKKQVERFRSSSETNIEMVLNSIENILENGSFNMSSIEDIRTLKEWVARIRHGNTVSR